MKILFLSDPNSIHTIKWVKSLANNNIIIHILGLTSCINENYANNKNITTEHLGLDSSTIIKSNGHLSKLKYLTVISKVKKTIKEFQPDILHAHYASSYGSLGALSGFSPFILSVWGSDIFDFPNKSILHKKLIQFNLKKADKILSTSHVMATEIKKYTKKKIDVTPFGIDITKFNRMTSKEIRQKL